MTELVAEVLIVAKMNLRLFARQRAWLLIMTVGPFFFLAPILMMAQTALGPGGEYRAPFVALTGYDDYLTYLLIPLIGVNVSTIAFSWISMLIRQEQQAGTLERNLMALQFPASLLIGRALAQSLFQLVFAPATFLITALFLPVRLQADLASAAAAIALHLLALYGTAFAMTTFFLWISDPGAFVQVVIRFVNSVLTGATIPLALFPGWLQGVAWAVPFTWAYDLERRALLRAEPLGAMLPDALTLLGICLVLWVGGFWLLGRMLQRAKATGQLGMY
jgi:ABC-2 type transport system permease protein